MTSVLDKAVEDRNLIVAENEAGAGPFVILCDHASNRIPEEYPSFGFATGALATHIAGTPARLPWRACSRQNLMASVLARRLPPRHRLQPPARRG